MGASHFRDLQATLLAHAAEATGGRDGLQALVGALHWEGPRGEQFRAAQSGSIGVVDDLVAELQDAAASAERVAAEIDEMMATVRALWDQFGTGVQIVWGLAGGPVVTSVVADGVEYLTDGVGGFVDAAGDLLGGVGEGIGDGLDRLGSAVGL